MNEVIEPKKSNLGHVLLGIVSILLVLIVISWYIFSREKGFRNTTDTGIATTTVANGLEGQLPPGVSVEVERISTDDAGPVPDMNRPIVFPAAYSQSARPTFLSKVADIKSQIAKSPRSSELWNELGLMFDVVEDYEGARHMWEYAVKLAPQSSVSFNNLGFLYGYRLHDYKKAEQNFKIAIANTPQDLYFYQQTFEFYRDVLKDSVKARALAAEGERITGNKEFFRRLLETL